MPKEAPNCCKGCIAWGMYGGECWVYWEGKKACTQHSAVNSQAFYYGR